jgi:hypothetical protein
LKPSPPMALGQAIVVEATRGMSLPPEGFHSHKNS